MIKAKRHKTKKTHKRGLDEEKDKIQRTKKEDKTRKRTKYNGQNPKK